MSQHLFNCVKQCSFFLVALVVCSSCSTAQQLGDQPQPTQQTQMNAKQLWTYKLQPNHYSVAAISADNKLAAIFDSEENEIRGVDLRNGKHLWSHIPVERGLREIELVFTPDSKQLLFCDPVNSTMLVLDATNGGILKKIVHTVGLYRPRFRQGDKDPNGKMMYCFSGEKTFEIVVVDLQSGTIEKYFDLREHSAETGIEAVFGNQYYRHRDFVVLKDRLVIGLGGHVMAFGKKGTQFLWKKMLSDARPVTLTLYDENTESLIAYVRTTPNICELFVETGEITRSIESPSNFVAGQQNGKLLTINHSGIDRPTTLRIVEWNSDTVYKHEISHLHCFDRVSCGPDGQHLLIIDASGQVICIEIAQTPTVESRTKR